MAHFASKGPVRMARPSGGFPVPCPAPSAHDVWKGSPTAPLPTLSQECPSASLWPAASLAPLPSPDACCPIPAADWRSLSQPGSSSSSKNASPCRLPDRDASKSSSPPVSGLYYSHSPPPELAGLRHATAAGGGRSGSGSLQDWQAKGSSHSGSFSLSGSASAGSNTVVPGVGSMSARHSQEIPHSGAFPQTHSSRRSLSSLCPSAAEARLEMQYAQKLQEESSKAGLKAEEQGSEGPERGAAGHQGQCVNWTEVEELCANMDKAGMTLEDIDILCLPPLEGEIASVADAHPDVPAGKKDGTLLSLKFSNMTLRHYPGDHNAKQLFQDVLSR